MGLHQALGLGQSIIQKSWHFVEAKGGQDKLGGLRILRWNEGDRIGRIAGALLGKEISDI